MGALGAGGGQVRVGPCLQGQDKYQPLTSSHGTESTSAKAPAHHTSGPTWAAS